MADEGQRVAGSRAILPRAPLAAHPEGRVALRRWRRMGDLNRAVFWESSAEEGSKAKGARVVGPRRR